MQRKFMIQSCSFVSSRALLQTVLLSGVSNDHVVRVSMR